MSSDTAPPKTSLHHWHVIALSLSTVALVIGMVMGVAFASVSNEELTCKVEIPEDFELVNASCDVQPVTCVCDTIGQSCPGPEACPKVAAAPAVGNDSPYYCIGVVFSKYKDESSGRVIDTFKTKKIITAQIMLEGIVLAVDDNDGCGKMEYYDLLTFMDTKPAMTAKAHRVWKVYEEGVLKQMKEREGSGIWLNPDILPAMKLAAL